VENADEIERSIASAASVRNSGLVFSPDATTVSYRDLIIAAVARRRICASRLLHLLTTGCGTNATKEPRRIVSAYLFKADFHPVAVIAIKRICPS
jgi:hypothetical protein